DIYVSCLMKGMRALLFLGFLLFTAVHPASVQAQDSGSEDDSVLFSLENPVALSGTQVNGIISNKDVVVHLWGLNQAESQDNGFQQDGLQILQNAVGQAPLSCEYKRRGSGSKDIIAQCDNSNKQDLGL